ncbi:TPA: YopJ/AvrA family T3SS effector serine/threonine acetyltransferase [Vibrio parahaemolyticus]|uniref:YopJ/AvrA family T3SS effector serine/threonine acetyltransferase n=1 Tax=Vibrio parahaemolyticus TaxID=670 RepID=UPI00041031AD|nr:YopJ/AvrA family T3SS effector serine/threonine acetyltransferase [Vibrio parahaemolyticus]AMG09653.1 multidrug DMT transporter permease [Vibrio parahaemolyticus]EGQ7778688.1 multidrug DMT transporter permease [Vibrio parahaemolyticus]EGQ8397887.1 multidrug DMT transporter permease [Vibrio parahaemolyticus]EGQ9049439.1 multidrug DMT transporter permease [Vibrio parahaemolyticus]EGQ9147945.1 multidrug DMT transporter permease [Vibrio parahaemolyticus]
MNVDSKAGPVECNQSLDHSFHDQLCAYIDLMDDAIKNGQQLPKDAAAGNDIALIPDFIDIANKKKAGLNAIFCNNPLEMVEKVKQLLLLENSSARFIVNLGCGGIHCMAVDCLVSDGKCSLIGIEPVGMNSSGPALLAIRLQSICKRELPEAALAIFETDMQRSYSECAMFSLFLVKKMHKESAQFQELHKKNIDQNLPKSGEIIVSVSQANNLLPPSLMKHVQSPKRLEAYLESRPEVADVVVNKKGETLLSRQQRYIATIEVEDKQITYSTSIEHKRLTEVKKLLESL